MTRFSRTNTIIKNDIQQFNNILRLNNLQFQYIYQCMLQCCIEKNKTTCISIPFIHILLLLFKIIRHAALQQ